MFGKIASGSSSHKVEVLAMDDNLLTPIVGRMVYFDFKIQGEQYRSLGTIVDIHTENSGINGAVETLISRGANPLGGIDLRKTTFLIQATFKLEDGVWVKHSSALPTSPSTGIEVNVITEETISEISDATYPTIGYFRGLEGIPQPLMLPDFGGSRGASHTGVLGRSGSGKTAMYANILAAQMIHEQHAILIIDPQGQWANENGIPLSPQRVAEGLGRDVSIIRVAEDIKLPVGYDETILSKMINKLGV